MKKNKMNVSLVLALFTLIFANACSFTNRTTNLLAGEWRIAEFDEQSHGVQGATSSNVGVIALNPDYTGNKVSSFSIMGLSSSDTTSFKWMNTENTIIIDAERNDDAKLWIITDLKRNTQTWRTTDGKASMQTMKLKRVQP
jgi:hypothetical protein